MNEYEMYVSGMSITAVHKATGIPLSTLRFRFKNKGILRSRSEGIRLADKQGLIHRVGNTKPKSKETIMLMRESAKKRGEDCAIGITYKSNGYVEFTRGPHKGKNVHTVFMEREIGRSLLPFEVVHHKDGIRCNNRLDNLELMTRSKHARLHALLNNSKRERDSKGRLI